jgi:hypothetical protein
MIIKLKSQKPGLKGAVEPVKEKDNLNSEVCEFGEHARSVICNVERVINIE